MSKKRLDKAGRKGVFEFSAEDLRFVRLMANGLKWRLPPHIEEKDLVGAGLLRYSEKASESIKKGGTAPTIHEMGGVIYFAMIDHLREMDHLTRGQREAVNRVIEEGGQSTDITFVDIDDVDDSFLPCTEAWELEENFDRNDYIELMKEALSHLTSDERNIILKYYFEFKTLKKIGNSLGITESRASQMLTEIRKKLRSMIDTIKKNHNWKDAL